MKSLPSSTYLIVSFFVVGFMGIFGHSLFAMDLARNLEIKKYHPKLESVLGRLAEEYSQDRMAMQKFARQRSIPLENGQVRVILVPPSGEDISAIGQTTLVSYGVTIEAISRHLMRAIVPISLLEEIADKVEGISYIRLPYKPFSDMISGESIRVSNSLRGSPVYPQQVSLGVISEGVELTGASDYHDLGYKGQGTKVGVIDIGFDNLAISQNAGELPQDLISKDFTGTGLETGRNHGTGVAEIVHDMAPETQLYLIKIADEVDLENAKDYCIDQDVDIINHSWIWKNTNFTDGTGFICDIVNDARSKGILWVNAAGNSAKSHYQGFFTDTDNDGWHEFSSGDEANDIEHEGGVYNVYLTWDCWPTTDQDYDLYLYDSDFNLVDFSATRQTGTQEPTEKITLSYLYAGTYHIMVKEHSATEEQEIKVVADTLEYQTPEHSICSPADATGAIAVGYVSKEKWTTGPQGPYSSQGPTNDGRIKPDIMGPANISSFTWGIGNFTSAATPHTSGAASLVLSRFGDYSLDQLRSTLEGWAVDMGSSGRDNVYGFGRLKLLSSPLLSWTGEANYESDGLDPEMGDSATEFVYRVKYVDGSNYAPENGYPKVHILKGGFEITGGPFTMNEVDPTDTTYTDGKIYTYAKTGLSAGLDYIYYFEAYDSHYKLLAIGEPTSETIGPTMVLSDNLEDLIVYPNPFNLSKEHTQINFDRLTIDARIRIFTLTGRLLKEEEVNWQYSWAWDVRNMEGEEVARGIYLWIVTNTMGGRKIGKIAIIK
ncbi:MAG: S8 family serine peptidase [Firmicutes bacterium]|nr:S8 family serine peptidase [Bacillota bacterium]